MESYSESPTSVKTASDSPMKSDFTPLMVSVDDVDDSDNTSPDFNALARPRKPSNKEMAVLKVGSPLIGLKQCLISSFNDQSSKKGLEDVPVFKKWLRSKIPMQNGKPVGFTSESVSHLANGVDDTTRVSSFN